MMLLLEWATQKPVIFKEPLITPEKYVMSSDIVTSDPGKNYLIIFQGI